MMSRYSRFVLRASCMAFCVAVSLPVLAATDDYTYTFLDYALSSGSQYIDTGITVTDKMEFRFKYAIVSPNAYKGPFGTYVGENNNATRIMSSNGSATTHLVNFMTMASGGSTSFANVTAAAGETVEGYMNYNRARLNSLEQDLKHEKIGTADTSTLTLFGRKDGYSTSIRIYYFQALNNGAISHNYIPCKRSDGKVGVYDTISGDFLYPPSGALTEGNVREDYRFVGDALEARVRLSYPSEYGSVSIGGSPVESGWETWTVAGSGSSVKLTAVPAVGCRLLRWEGAGVTGQTATTVTVPAGIASDLTAVFATMGHYVDAVNGDDAYDGSAPVWAGGESLRGPKKTMAAANELMASGDTLLIAPGEYKLETEIANAKQVTYRGIDPDGDATKVVINGQGKCRGFNLSENSRIEGLTVSNCYNDVDEYGGGVRFWYLGTITNCVIVGCTNAFASGKGGGVAFSNDRGGSRHVQDCRFLLNRAVSYGGGLYHRGGTGTYLYVRDCQFEGNTGSSGGGSFSERDNKYVEYRDCTFVGNYGTGEAGALSKQVSLVSNCVFRANWSKGTGGVYAHGDYSGIKPFYDCLFEDNKSTNDVGGAIALSRTGMATFNRCHFYRNKAKGRGTAIWASSANAEQFKLIDCDFSGNANDAEHTAFPQVVVAGQPQLVSGSFFTNNLGIALSTSADATDWVANGYPRPVVTNCLFADNGAWNFRDTNQTVYRGGALCFGSYGSGGPGGTRCPLVSHCQFYRNSVTNAATLKSNGNGADGGGAVFAPLDIEIEDCHFEDNKVGYGLGGAFCGDATGGIRRCSFVGNSVGTNLTSLGSAIDFNMSPVKELTNRVYNVVEDCAFTNNSSAKVGALSASPVISVGRGNLKISRCDFYANTNTTTSTSGTHYPACIAFFTHFTMISSQSDKEEVDGNKFPRYLACENCTFEKNYGTGTGVGLSLHENHSTVPGVPNTRGYVRNCLFKDNTVSVGKIGAVTMKGCGSAIVVNMQSLAVDNCTFVGNYADAALASQKPTTGAIHCGGTNAVVRNCVFYDNKNLTKKGDIYCANADQLNAFSNCFETTGGKLTDGVNGCIVSDQNPFRADDHTAYAVRKDCGSAAGLKLDWMTSDSLDLGGKPRLAKDGTVDFGCYQFWRKPGLLLFVW